jgi:hypothetical protein
MNKLLIYFSFMGYGSAINLDNSPIDLTNALNKFTIFELYDPEGLFEDPIEVILARFVSFIKDEL